MLHDRRFFVAVTGAQGVGKSTFCARLVEALAQAGLGDFLLLDDLRGRVAAAKVPLGSGSTPATIHAVWVAHLEREQSPAGQFVLLDRCMVDALAYTRVLKVSSDLELRLFEQVALRSLPFLNLIVHLQLNEFFLNTGKPHETTEHRHAVALEIEEVIAASSPPVLNISAEQPDALEKAVEAVRVAMDRYAAE
jgi:thymidylate kinase